MCGISGIFELNAPAGAAARDQRDVALGAVSTMNGRLGHRGPDDRGTAVTRSASATTAFGHTRLSILDLSAAGHQPMARRGAADLQITFNGEIYNFRELREELGAAEGDWSTGTDTEVILRAYERWGADSFRRLRGMFAFAIRDARSECLVLARDSFGIKPLYYFRDGDKLIFGSELRALLSSGMVPKELCPDGLASYLSYGSVQAPLSIIRGVRMLMPGTYLTVSSRDGRLEADERAYAADLHRKDGGGGVPVNRRDAAVRLREVLEDSVRHHLISDVPVGAFLSGGIDSSAIVALMSRVTAERPRTFSVVFDEKEFTEAEYARTVSRKFGTEHQEVRLSEGELLDMLPHALSDMDHPTTDGINTYVVARAVRDSGIKVALSGLGGDELFAGYPSFRRALLMKRFSFLPAGVRKATASVGRTLLSNSVQQRKAWDLLGGELSPAYAYSTSRQLFSAREVTELIGARATGNGHKSPPPAGSKAGEDFINAVSFLELKGYMADTLLRDADQMGMAHSLEVRVPFIDSEVVPYVTSLPGSWKVDPRRPKPLLLDALGDLLPEQIWRRRKMGFTLPFERWMRSELSRELDEALNSRVGFLTSEGRSAARRVWDGFKRTPRRERWSRPWTLYVLSKWCELNGVRT